jgi:hypothetical protein
MGERALLIVDRGKYKWGRMTGKGRRGYGLWLNTQRWMSLFTFNDCRENEGKKSRTKKKMSTKLPNHTHKK